MERGGTGDRQESATNLLGFKVSHSASFLLCSVKYKSCYRIRQSFTQQNKARSAFKLGDWISRFDLVI